MSQPIAQATIQVRIVEGHFLIEDEDIDPPAFPAFEEADDWLLTTHNQIAVCSASGEWHVPEALLQRWTTTPPSPGPGWEVHQQRRCHFSSGALNILNPAREEIFGTFDLETPGSYHVRAHTTDRDRTRRMIDHAATTAGDQPIRGIEKFLIQFWRAPEHASGHTSTATEPHASDWLTDVTTLERTTRERRQRAHDTH
ncbi:hypothetical protein [Amycolatopsis keratiniphila]|uniref:Uncharacterized protein n=1 Tax=Amycolatopsis keratiniphila subsp. keratiniphila TaxID=227715 RepID=A0A1W2LKH0_9PSEU|nr:hypothetical protein [Amycolatopsis keratiniphila]ONF63343.1 hypothetical protein AVR91_0234935 [Amycolatopsis keratiniphila subsp. keratiniphila]